MANSKQSPEQKLMSLRNSAPALRAEMSILLRDLARDPKAPATARTAAIRELMILLREIESEGTSAPVTEMTSEQLDDEIRRLQKPPS